MRILIVDDDSSSQKVLQKHMVKYGVCDVATNGAEALILWETALEAGDAYKVICLDIQMPELNGLELLKIIRGKEAEKKIPQTSAVKVIMISASKDEKSLLTSFKLGCEGFIAKPITTAALTDQMKRLGFEPSNS